MSKLKPQKIAILGGGMASLTAAFELTSEPRWRDRYDVTVYQDGWRVGGKGASGRNLHMHDRIEEHGLHVLMGFYENAFRLIRACYTELGRTPDQALATWQEAFHPHHHIVHQEHTPDGWRAWPMEFPANLLVPGDGSPLLVPWDYLRRSIRWMIQIVDSMDMVVELRGLAMLKEEIRQRAWEGIARGQSITEFLDRVMSPLERVIDRVGMDFGAALLFLVDAWLESAPLRAETAQTDDYDVLRDMIARFVAWLRIRLVDCLDHSHNIRHAFIILDFLAANARGMLSDRLLAEDSDFGTIDHLDYREWLRRNGASRQTLDSAPVRAVYDLIFCRGAGIAAGVALVGTMRMLLGYKGAVFYRMQGGMGDVVFAPLYLVLRRRGVKFEFYHRVEEVVPSADCRSIQGIRIARQASLRTGVYEPLVDVRGLPCWPSAPLYDQLVEGAELERRRVDLESHWTDWRPVERLHLERGRDFDLVVLGISIGALTHVCPRLLAHSAPMRKMVEQVTTTPTQAFQIWFHPKLGDMGWPGPATPLQTAYEAPFDTWADMSHLTSRESWPEPAPGNIAYFCGKLDAPGAFVSPDASFPRREQDRVRENAQRWLERCGAHLWPNIFQRGGIDEPAAPAGMDRFDASVLVDPVDRVGPARFSAQYYRANVNPSDRFVQSVPGSTRFRLRTDESGYDNLYMTGDWIRTPLNVGCIEAAVMGGMQTARAVAGYPREITGEVAAGAARQRSAHGGASIGPILERAATRPPPPGSLPAYVDRGGELVLRSPYTMRATRLFIFGLKACYEALSALCERYLNAPISAALYRPAIPYVLIGCADISTIRSDHAADRNKGQISELEIALWIPLWGGRTTEHQGFIAERLVWFSPYIFVDNSLTMAAGREIYGFPKQLASIQIPRSEGDRAEFSASTLVLDPFAATTVARSHRVLGVRRVDRIDLGLQLKGTSFTEATRSIVKLLRAGVDVSGGLQIPSPRLLSGLLDNARRGHVPMVFLQQFRDVEQPDRACYQAVIEATAIATQVRGGGPLVGDYEIDVASFASHPIREDLGLPEGPLRPGFAGWVEFDFRMERGRVLWNTGRAPSASSR